MADEKKGGALAAFAKKEGAVVTREARAAALARAKEARGTAGGGDVDYLSFSGQGARYKGWTIGRDKQTPDPETMYAVGVDTVVLGWTCWMNGKAVKKHRWLATDFEQELLFDDLDHSLAEGATDGDGWKEMIGFSMISLDDPDRIISFETTSASGVNSVRDLLDLIEPQVIAGEPETPIIKLDDDTFESKAGKVNGKPLFPVQGWVTEEEVIAYKNDPEGDPDDLLNGKYAVKKAATEEEPSTTKRRPRRQNAA